MNVHHPLRFVMALYPLYGWIYFLVLKAHCPIYVVDFVLAFFPVWIFYENFVCFYEYHNIPAIIFVNILSFPVPFFMFYTFSLGHYFYLTLAYLVFYVSLGVYFNVKMFH